MEVIVYVFISLFFFSLLYAFISLNIKYRHVSNLLLQAQIDRDLFRSKLAEEVAKRDNKKIEQTEGFVKFISQSREWAFKYIEDVQEALKALEGALEILKSSKIKAEDRKRAMEIISSAMKHLPED